MNGCCGDSVQVGETAPQVRKSGAMRRVRDLAGWAAPGAALALVPKCPACIAAYIALATGVGVSMTTAAHIRVALISVCTAALTFVAARRFTRFAGSAYAMFNRSN
jgi:Flp pilus assembly protein TadB